MIYVWLAILVVSVITEFITTELVSIWFASGALISLILAILQVPLIWQIVAFVLISALFIIFGRKPLMKLLSKDKSKTNSDANIGKVFTLISPISFGQVGSIKVNDVVWSAIATSDDIQIKEGCKVEIVAIKGNKFIVKEI